MARPTRDRKRSSSPNLEKAADRGSQGSRSSPRRPDLSKPEIEGGTLGITASREYNDAFPGITNKESVTVGFDDLFKKNNVSGNIDPQNKSGSISVGFGTKAVGANFGIGIDFRDGWIPNIAIDFGAKIAGVGGNLGINTRGGGKIGLGLGPGSIEVATDKNGNKSITFCYGVPGLEVCNEYSATEKWRDIIPGKQSPLRPKPAPKPPIAKPLKPKKPKLPIAKKRTKPKPKPKKPKPKPVPRPRPVPKPIKPKRPPVLPKPKPVPTPKPKPIPVPPKPPRPIPPTPTPVPSPLSKPKRPSPWPRTEPTPAPTPYMVPCGTGSWTLGGFARKYNQSTDSFSKEEFCETGEYLDRLLFGVQVANFNDYSGYNSAQLQNPDAAAIELANRGFGAGNWFRAEDVIITNYFGNGYVGNWFWDRTSGSLLYWNTGAIKAKWSFKLPVFQHNDYIKNQPWMWWGIQYGLDYDYKYTLEETKPPPPNSLSGIPCSTMAPPTPTFNPPRLPNTPTKIKPMDCCKDIKEIYKYLGIAKIKKNKFKVAKAFMVPGGTGNEECEDYYQLQQAIVRMLANGLIINPVSNPLGTEWKSVNATAWAGQVYEMVAEAMSNGNSSQKYEIAMMMQVTQLLAIVAEQTRKIEFLSEVLGIDPDLDTEDIPACFTIYEGHKGFGKKDPKKIDIGKAKTDDEVESVLGKMLQPSKIPITKWVLKADSKSIVEILLDQ